MSDEIYITEIRHDETDFEVEYQIDDFRPERIVRDHLGFMHPGLSEEGEVEFTILSIGWIDAGFDDPLPMTGVHFDALCNEIKSYVEEDAWTEAEMFLL